MLAVDQGTSGTKALVICPEHGVIGTGFAAVHPRHLPGGLVEADPEELYRSVPDAGRWAPDDGRRTPGAGCRALAEAGEPVAALGLANQGETVLASVCAGLDEHADELRHLTGLPLEAVLRRAQDGLGGKRRVPAALTGSAGASQVGAGCRERVIHHTSGISPVRPWRPPGIAVIRTFRTRLAHHLIGG